MGAARTEVVKVKSKRRKVKNVRMTLRMVVKVILALLVVVGIGLSVKDYRAWKWEETRNYGHGPVEALGKPMELNGRYINPVVGIRVKYPEGWVSTGKVGLKTVGKNKAEVVRIDGGEIRIIVKVALEERAEITVADEMIEELKNKGISLARERDYYGDENEDWTVLTWDEGEKTVRMGFAITNGKIVVVEAESNKGGLDKWILTIDGIIRGTRIT